MNETAHRTTPELETRGGGGDPLSAMYVLAAVAMFVGAIVVLALMLVPTDWRDRLAGPSDDAYVPGSSEGFRPLGRPAVVSEAPGLRQLEPGRYLATIEAYNWYFTPAEIRVPVGSEVVFHARSMDDYHGIALVGTDLILSLGQNDVAEGSYTFDEPGEYTWVCAEYCGAGHVSMTGKVIVE